MFKYIMFLSIVRLEGYILICTYNTNIHNIQYRVNDTVVGHLRTDRYILFIF